MKRKLFSETIMIEAAFASEFFRVPCKIPWRTPPRRSASCSLMLLLDRGCPGCKSHWPSEQSARPGHLWRMRSNMILLLRQWSCPCLESGCFACFVVRKLGLCWTRSPRAQFWLPPQICCVYWEQSSVGSLHFFGSIHSQQLPAHATAGFGEQTFSEVQ